MRSCGITCQRIIQHSYQCPCPPNMKRHPSQNFSDFSLIPVIHGTSYIDNPIHRLFTPQAGQRVDIAFDGTALSLSRVTVFGATWSYSQHKKTIKSVQGGDSLRHGHENSSMSPSSRTAVMSPFPFISSSNGSCDTEMTRTRSCLRLIFTRYSQALRSPLIRGPSRDSVQW
jgi:hypothetical protein